MSDVFSSLAYSPLFQENKPRSEQVEISSARSYVGQLTEQLILAKAYMVIAEKHNNLQLARELNSKIRTSQIFLSKAAMQEKPIYLDEAEPIIRSLSTLIFKAQVAHYDIATTMMIMKSHIQALEERVRILLLI